MVTELLKTILAVIKTINNKQQNDSKATENINNKVNSIAEEIINMKKLLNGTTSNYLNPQNAATVPAGDSTTSTPAVLCNITEYPITVTITVADTHNDIQVSIPSGFYPIVVEGVKGAIANTLIYAW